MAVLAIRVYPDPVLRNRCPEVEAFDGALARLAADMIETMHQAPGVGLAAPQIGAEARLAVVDVSVGEDEEAVHVLVNPVILERDGEESDFEGCLSIPDYTEKISRPLRIKVEAQTVEGVPFTLEAEGFLARVICHEVDHLNGVLFVDHLRGLKREKARRHLKRLKREVEIPA